ncbi:hypothetical protein J7W19_16465 [Streptomyces mobaraensis NBRC 13819 = DSM 40847]|uniref:Uncharacterized protein n=1 Tax=Streptomyces mobaraensis (strain ATCC 29032 / DSM 40847 / JCM 4168 / NBRC 13819 / NCIMB 11159 / IPCR 16-22) TaxID=1223523 RepID=M3C498_STRM1|nr:hypothetical protein [Streptomyces mobaraensis]EME98785.1 hypothetical protein H340_19693 [Streptomyces mobaraensis NBRC 13819 = DSM 40847]QTT74773.1 hypothetical protein J7W19_16465 [Streptomyces mobaraensis NBRC 13819 = DSM 40847]
MRGADDGAFEGIGAEFDPDAVVWVRGVDYVAGWREAREAAAELETALTAVGVEVEGTAAAQTRGDGSGVVRVVWSPETVRAVARLICDTA